MLFKRFLDILSNRLSAFAHMFETAAILTLVSRQRRRGFSIGLQHLNSNERERQG